MSYYRRDLKPTFGAISEENDLISVQREILKVKPKVEVTIEGMPEMAKGRITEWHPPRKFFAVEWDKKTDAFSDQVESRAELRVFFKAHLFSTQLIFKTVTVRRFSDSVYHFRIPEQLFKQQQRGALRVPIRSKSATLSTPEGDFEIVDLSVGGAKLKVIERNNRVRLGSTLMNCELKLGRKKLRPENFGIKITAENEASIGCRFSGLEALDKALIKEFLMEALRIYYKEDL